MNSTQQNLLDDFIGEKGIYFETIKEDKIFDLGTKVLYLERAISQNCQNFLQSLDKLYNPCLSDEAKTDHVELIRALKLINDLCFNHQVKYEIKYDDFESDFEIRSALTHYFGLLDHDIEPRDFQETIQKIINERITELCIDHEKEAEKQKVEREAAEENIAPQVGWRTELDLPTNQLPQEAYAELNNDAIDRLVDEGHILFSDLTALDDTIRIEIFRNSHAVAWLVNRGHILFADLIALDDAMRTEIFGSPHEVAWLVNEGHILFADLIALDDAMRTEIFRNSHAVAWLVNEGHIPFADLIALDDARRTEIFKNSHAVTRLVNRGHIPFADLIALDDAMRIEIFRSSDEVAWLVNEGHIFNEGHIPFADLIALDDAMRAEIFRNSYAVTRLIDEGRIPFADLIALDGAMRTEIFKNSPAVVQLLKNKEGIASFKQLSSLSIAQLHLVIADPKSKASQKILNLSSSSPGSLSMFYHFLRRYTAPILPQATPKYSK
jgi:hypothetical protein